MMNIVQTLTFLEDNYETLTVGCFNEKKWLLKDSLDPEAASLFVERKVIEKVIDLFDLYFSSDKSTGLCCLLAIHKIVETDCDIIQYVRTSRRDLLLEEALDNIADFVYDKMTNKGGRWYELWSEWKSGQ